MATNNSSNQDYTNNADGFTLGGGTTKRKVTVTGADMTLTGSGTNTYTMPSSSDTLLGVASFTGVVVDYAGSSAPTGWLLCDGSAVSRTTYANLFAAIGTTWGAGDGSTTFNLPNLARRVTVGSGGTGSSTLANTLGSTGGEEAHLLTAAESGLPAHSHTFAHTSPYQVSNSPAYGYGSGATAIFNDGSNNTINNNTAAGASSAHNNIQPSAVMNKVIKT